VWALAVAVAVVAAGVYKLVLVVVMALTAF
jgi:uncharacterized membrane protein